MFRSLLTGVAVLGILAVVVGCSDGVVKPREDAGDAVSASELGEVAMQSDLVMEQILRSQLDSMGGVAASATGEDPGTVTQDVTFSLSRPCPAGGEMHVEGMIHRTFNRETRVMEAESSGSRTRTDCTFAHREMTLTINSAAQWEAFRRRVDGVPDGLQTNHYYGSTSAVRSDGEERSCEFDVSLVRDPDTHTRTLDGTICGTEIHRSVTWSHDE